MNKTLIGKENYLFLQNDSARELEVHQNNLDLVTNELYLKYNEIINKYLLIIFPNKSFIQKQFLPDDFNLKYRPAFDKYNEFLKEHILDGYIFLKDQIDCYYKTDTHINFKGNYIIYHHFIDKINNSFNLNIGKKNINITEIFCPEGLSILEKGIGDLTWSSNLGDQVLENLSDKYYYSNEIRELYPQYKFSPQSKIRILNKDLEDKTNEHLEEKLHWEIISNYILYQKNNLDTKIKVLIFYDSFLLPSIDLYIDMFDEVYFSKSIYELDLIQKINPDYVFEFRCERFLF
jgi:hypothetical protein